MIRRIVIGVAVLTLLCAFGIIGAYRHSLYQYWHSPAALAAPKEILIKPGTPSQRIIETLEARGVINQGWLFKVLALRFDHLRRYKAGEYAFVVGMTPQQVSEMLVDGRTIQRSMTIPEGWVSAQVVSALNQEPLLQEAISVEPVDGALLPETYFFVRGESRLAMIEKMRRAMQETLDQLWNTRQPSLPLQTKEEALILASIVEKETGVADERRRVAGVFINRLRIGMPLQSDPTVNYGMYLETGALKTRLMRKDLKHDSPYNTYRINGLPPSPICNPGKASIEAVLNPSDTDELYFVADGKGGHVFAKTLREHNRNVAAYYRTLRE